MFSKKPSVQTGSKFHPLDVQHVMRALVANDPRHASCKCADTWDAASVDQRLQYIGDSSRFSKLSATDRRVLTMQTSSEHRILSRCTPQHLAWRFAQPGEPFDASAPGEYKSISDLVGDGPDGDKKSVDAYFQTATEEERSHWTKVAREAVERHLAPLKKTLVPPTNKAAGGTNSGTKRTAEEWPAEVKQPPTKRAKTGSPAAVAAPTAVSPLEAAKAAASAAAVARAADIAKRKEAEAKRALPVLKTLSADDVQRVHKRAKRAAKSISGLPPTVEGRALRDALYEAAYLAYTLLARTGSEWTFGFDNCPKTRMTYASDTKVFTIPWRTVFAKVLQDLEKSREAKERAAAHGTDEEEEEEETGDGKEESKGAAVATKLAADMHDGSSTAEVIGYYVALTVTRYPPRGIAWHMSLFHDWCKVLGAPTKIWHVPFEARRYIVRCSRGRTCSRPDMLFISFPSRRARALCRVCKSALDVLENAQNAVDPIADMARIVTCKKRVRRA